MIETVLSRAIDIYRSDGFSTLLRMGVKFWRHSMLPGVQLEVWNALRPRVQAVRYAAPASPDKILWINPSEIRYYNLEKTYKRGLGRVESGDWDVESKSLDDHRTHRGLTQRFTEGLAWEETDYPPKDYKLRAK
jgi:hypothetical protein